MSYPWYIQLIILLSTNLVVAYFIAVVTVNLSLRRFYKERWWEKKADAYSRIIDALHKHKNYAENKLNGEFIDNPDTSIETMLRQQWAEGKRELDHAVDLGTFIISEEAELVLNKFQKRKLPDFREESFTGIIETDLKYIQTCLTDIKAAAKRDLSLLDSAVWVWPFGTKARKRAER